MLHFIHKSHFYCCRVFVKTPKFNRYFHQSSVHYSKMSSEMTNPFVTCEWLAERIINKEKLSIFDCSWYPPADKRDCKAEFLAGHIPRAQFFDIDEIADKQTDLPHMLPPPRQFEEQVSALGVSNDSHVVVYDTSGYYFASARVWWTFRVFGHDRISVLAGGFLKWKQFGLPIETGTPPPPIKGNFKVETFRKDLVVNLDEIKQFLEKKHFQLIDARSKERFDGKGPERPKVRFGHIPGAKNLHFMQVIEPGTGLLRPPDELTKLFQNAEIDLTKPIVCSCASGVSASVLTLALYKLGRKDVAVYDGSWTEYGSERYNHPIETAPNITTK